MESLKNSYFSLDLQAVLLQPRRYSASTGKIVESMSKISSRISNISGYFKTGFTQYRQNAATSSRRTETETESFQHSRNHSTHRDVIQISNYRDQIQLLNCDLLKENQEQQCVWKQRVYKEKTSRLHTEAENLQVKISGECWID
ncbi:uncharacterized protein LOC144484298 isoform X2 [Mustelus asterias]